VIRENKEAAKALKNSANKPMPINKYLQMP